VRLLPGLPPPTPEFNPHVPLCVLLLSLPPPAPPPSQALCECVSILGFLLLLLDHLLPGSTRECLLILAYRRHTQLPQTSPGTVHATGGATARGGGKHTGSGGSGAGAGAGAGAGGGEGEGLGEREGRGRGQVLTAGAGSAAGGERGWEGGAVPQPPLLQGSRPPWGDFESLCLVSRRTTASAGGLLSWARPSLCALPTGRRGREQPGANCLAPSGKLPPSWPRRLRRNCLGGSLSLRRLSLSWCKC